MSRGSRSYFRGLGAAGLAISASVLEMFLANSVVLPLGGPVQPHIARWAELAERTRRISVVHLGAQAACFALLKHIPRGVEAQLGRPRGYSTSGLAVNCADADVRECQSSEQLTVGGARLPRWMGGPRKGS